MKRGWGAWLLPISLALATPLPGVAGVHHVRIENLKFVPETLEATVGDTVIWDNADLVPHTATAVGKEKGKRLFDSGTLDQGKTFKFRISKPGEIDYLCLFHPMMKGKIIARAKSAVR